MNRDRQSAAIADAQRILADARRAKATPTARSTAREDVADRQRVKRASIQRRRSATRRTRLARRAGTNALLVGELGKVRVRAAEAKPDVDALLRFAFTATCASTPQRPIRTDGDRKLNQRCAPLRFIVDLGEEHTTEDARAHLSKRLGVELGDDATRWPSLEPLFRRGKRHRHFVLTLPLSNANGKQRRFHIARAIKERTRAVSVQPSEPITLNASVVDIAAGPPPLDTEWPLDTMNVGRAWELDPPGAGRRLGAGVTIGHLDSGWFDHPEYDREQLDLDRAYNASTDSVSETAAAHSFEGGPNETHGVATGALMVSRVAATGSTDVTTVPAGPAEPANDDLQITGVAPEATVLPVRCLDFVFVTMDNVDLVRGAEYLIEPDDPDTPAKVEVVSMSLGGVPHFTLEEVLNVGVRDKNVIPIAAAGQVYVAPLPVAAPAAYPEVIAVAATNPDDEPAGWTFSGPEIDVAAPGEAVWIADVRGEDRDDGTVAVNTFVGYGHGTSFSCALTAGTAALWRAFYAAELDSGAYDGVPLARVFRQHLRDTARRPDGWETASFGAGIVDVEALLSTPLPAPDAVPLPSSVVPFNPFIASANAFEGAVEAFDGLVAAGTELGERLVDAGVDAWNSTMVTLAEMAAAGGAFVDAAIAVGTRMAEEAAGATVEFLSDLWTDVAQFADEAGDEIGRRAAAVADAVGDAWEDAVEAAEDAAEAAAEAVEDAAEEVVETVEEIVDAVAEGAEEVVDFFTGLFG